MVQATANSANSIFVILPAYNEAKQIGRVIRGLFQEPGLKAVAPELQLIVVDDASQDATAEEAYKAGAMVVRHASNRGQGAALQTGNDLARSLGAQIVVHFDADGQFNPHDIAGAIALIKRDEVDIVLGSRFLDDRSEIPWFKRHIILPVGRRINFVFTGLELTDVHNGFRVLSRLALDKIIITHDRMAHNTEIPAQIKKYNLRWREYPVEVRYFEPGQGLGGGVRILWDLFLASLK